MPLHRRLPKRGFSNPFRKEYRTVNVDRLAELEAGSVVTPESMQSAGLLRKGSAEVKVLGNGELKVALTVKAHKFTKMAAEKITPQAVNFLARYGRGLICVPMQDERLAVAVVDQSLKGSVERGLAAGAPV